MSVKSWLLLSDAHSNTWTVVSFSKSQKTKSILKTISSRFPTAPEAADAKSCSPSPEPPTRSEDSEFDNVEVERMSMLAGGALKIAKDARKAQQQEELKALKKELASCKGALELFSLFERDYRQSQDKQARALAKANRRLEAAYVEVEQALFAKNRAEGLRKKREEQVGILQQELTVVRQENEGMRISLENLSKESRAHNGGGCEWSRQLVVGLESYLTYLRVTSPNSMMLSVDLRSPLLLIR